MNHTDYSKIAQNYDLSDSRHLIKKDQVISMLVASGRKNIRVLDLGCGTGNYLKHQSEKYFQEEPIEWYGLDASSKMLEISKEKLEKVKLTLGNAEELPFEDSFFDYVICNHAYHHFDDKVKAFKEVYRVLKPDGGFFLKSVYPHLMKNSWVYSYFESVMKIDEERFLDKEALKEVFRNIGFGLRFELRIYDVEQKLDLILDEASLRNYSQLSLVNDREYESGISKIKEDLDEFGSRYFEYAKIQAFCTKNSSFQ